jgi:glutathione S-transferase
MAYRLYDFPASPFCIKIRAILDYKGVPFERISVVGPALVALRRRGGIGKVPALEMDGRLICDSTDIAYALERRHPSPPILPREPRQRATCHVLEDWADESLYWLGVYYRWADPEGRAGAGAVFGRAPLVGRLLSSLVAAESRRQLKGQGLGRKSPEHVARDLQRQLEHLSALLDGQDYLLGDEPMLCDFAVGGQLVYLRRTPYGQRQIEGHAAITAFLDRMKRLRTAARDS